MAALYVAIQNPPTACGRAGIFTAHSQEPEAQGCTGGVFEVWPLCLSQLSLSYCSAFRTSSFVQSNQRFRTYRGRNLPKVTPVVRGSTKARAEDHHRVPPRISHYPGDHCEFLFTALSRSQCRCERREPLGWSQGPGSKAVRPGFLPSLLTHLDISLPVSGRGHQPAR